MCHYERKKKRDKGNKEQITHVRVYEGEKGKKEEEEKGKGENATLTTDQIKPRLDTRRQEKRIVYEIYYTAVSSRDSYDVSR